MDNEPYWLGHRERLRERAQSAGLESLKPHELIELVLFYAVPRADMSEVARALISEFGSTEAVFAATRDRLMAVPGVTRAAADWIMMTGELIRAYMRVDRGELEQIRCFRDVLRFILPRRLDVRAPQCWMLYTDFDDHLMTYSVVCESLYWMDGVYTRQIVEEALALQARHAVMVLFVGASPLEMSKYEMDYLLSFSRTLRAIEVELIDCVLVGEAGCISMNLEGGMEDIRLECAEHGLHERYAGDDGAPDADVLK